MLYLTSSNDFKRFLLTGTQILRTCFPQDTETGLVRLINDFASSRSVTHFEKKYCDFSAELDVWGHTSLTNTLTAPCIPLGLRTGLFVDILNITETDPIEQYRLTQVLLSL